MSLPESITQYCQSVCEQVRWKKIHPLLSEELEDHITDQADTYRASGASETDAVDRAIRQMGDPIAVGTALDRTHRPKPQWGMLVLTLLMFGLGVGIRLFLAPSSNLLQTPVILGTALCGIAVFFLTYFLDFSLLGKCPKTIYFSTILLSVLALLTSTRPMGMAAWHSISLSHLALIFPLAFALLVYALRNRGYGGILLCALGYVGMCAILLPVPSLGGVFLLSIVALLLFCIALIKRWFAVKRGIVASVVFLLTLFPLGYLFSNAYFQGRLALAIHPETDPIGTGWLSCFTRALLKNAEWVGAGTVPAPYAGYHLPGFETDFILTHLISRIGWISLLVIAVVLLAFLIRGFVLCFRQRSILGQVVSLSILTTFTVEIITYFISNLGFLMLYPLFLPLLSYGTASLLLHMALLGILLSVFRNGEAVRDYAPHNLRTGDRKLFALNDDGTITIDLRLQRKP